MSSKLKNCFKPLSLSTAPSIGLFLIRLVAGLAMILHGWGKIQSPFGWMPPDSGVPGFFQFLAALSEFGGGIAWIVGLLMPLASLGMTFTMLVATLLHAVVLKDPFVSKGGGSYELALLYFVLSILFILVGPGKFSVDSKIFGSK